MPTTRINDIEMYYEEHGDAAAEPVLLIMGFLTNSAAWAPQIAALTPRYHVIAFDNRGSGRSSQPPGSYTVPQMADDAAALLDRLGIAAAHVVGASMGGMIAQELALRHPAKVRTLVLACTTPGGPRSFGYQGWLDRKAEAEAVSDPSQLWTPERVKEYVLLLFTPEFLAAPREGFGQYVAGVMQHPSTSEGAAAQGEAVLLHDTLDRLGEIRVPTLVVTGDADELVDARNSPLLAARIPGAEIRTLPGQRHAFTAEQPDETNSIILDFLARHATIGVEATHA